MEAARQPLPGGRWHWQHGPIDIVAGAEGDPAAVHAAHEAAWARFQVVLRELVAELPLLKLPVEAVGGCPLQGPVARRMWHACAPHAAVFITPMAAVAGAVAEELVAFYRREGITRAWVNNGGDIALHLAPGASVRAGLFADLARFDEQAARQAAAAACRWTGASRSVSIRPCAAWPPAAGAGAASRSAWPMPSPCWPAARPRRTPRPAWSPTR
ncbi:MAG: hypothetical protein U1F50_08510 [Rubrivivax sp.]